jgi:ATP-binding cassette subfamily D (ALD) protein 3
MGTYDQLLSKYGAVLLSYLIQALPIFGPEREKYLSKYKNNASLIARDYIRNAGLLVNLARAIGKIIGTYKNI